MQYQIKRNPRATRVTLRIDEWGQLIVSVPMRFPESRVADVLVQAKDWIERHQKKISRRLEQSPELGDKGNILLLGTPHKLELGRTTGVEWDEVGRILRVHPVAPTQESAEKALTRFVRSIAERELFRACKVWSGRMSQQFESITLREQKSRWGSCSSAGSLNFNWKLAHAPLEVLEYVVIHELAHRRHMDHSRSFWALVARHDGQYEEHRSWLQKHGDRIQRNIREAAELLFASTEVA